MKIKLSNPLYADFTGHLGQVEFLDGVSVDDVGSKEIDRFANSFPIEDEAGNSLGIATRLINEAKYRAPMIPELDRQTDTERAAEELLLALRSNSAPTDRIYTVEELEAVASKDGIKGLRVAAEPWGVKSRSIPELIGMIIKSQNKFMDDRQARVEMAAAEKEDEVVEFVEDPHMPEEAPVEPVVVVPTDEEIALEIANQESKAADEAEFQKMLDEEAAAKIAASAQLDLLDDLQGSKEG